MILIWAVFFFQKYRREKICFSFGILGNLYIFTPEHKILYFIYMPEALFLYIYINKETLTECKEHFSSQNHRKIWELYLSVITKILLLIRRRTW